jgi:hypothetical protein
MKLVTLTKQNSSTGGWDETLVNLDKLVYMTERTFFFKFVQPHEKKENRHVTELRLGGHLCIYVKETAEEIKGML